MNDFNDEIHCNNLKNKCTAFFEKYWYYVNISFFWTLHLSANTNKNHKPFCRHFLQHVPTLLLFYHCEFQLYMFCLTIGCIHCWIENSRIITTIMAISYNSCNKRIILYLHVVTKYGVVLDTIIICQWMHH